MTNLEHLRQLFTAPPYLSPLETQDYERINAQCHGWSARKHYIFFRTLLSHFPLKSVLVLGVYLGRDCAYLSSIARQLNHELHITGVDKFSDDFCEDWPEADRAKSWKEAWPNDPYPDVDVANANLKALSCDNVTLIKQRDEEFLARTTDRYDLIYIDTSHDESTVKRQMISCLPLLNPDGIMAGDDYSNDGTWGVISAVKASCADHVVHANWIWCTTAEQLHKP